jgi:hypothetical protein
MDINQLLDEYVAEFNNDFDINQLNINNTSFEIIKLKHKWIERLIRAKKDLLDIEKILAESIDKVALKISQESDAPVSIPNAERMATKTPKIAKIIEVIGHQKLVIEYLERVEKISRDSGFDIKNIVDLIKLENT